LHHFKKYLTYLLIGGVVGVLALLSRELAGRLLPNTRFWYVFLILIIYCGGILVSFILQKRYTFRGATSTQPRRQLFLFVLLAIFTGFLTAALSYFLRYGLDMDIFLGKWAPTAAFGLATLATSTLNFFLNSHFIFYSYNKNN
jgi:putative flippase GtrA